MRLTYTVDARDAFVSLDRQNKHARYAAAVALTRTAYIARAALQREMQSVFDRPTPYALSSIRVTPATRDKLFATVGLGDEKLGKATLTPEQTLGHEYVGGRRLPGAFELRLRQMGYLQPGWFAVPGMGARLDAYGNMSRGQIKQILSYFDIADKYHGVKSNMGEKGRERAARTMKSRRGYEYFISRGPGHWFGGRSWKNGRDQHLPAGIYQRTSFTAKDFGGSAIKPVVLFVRSVSYTPRVKLPEILDRVVEKNLAFEWERAIEEELMTRAMG